MVDHPVCRTTRRLGGVSDGYAQAAVRAMSKIGIKIRNMSQPERIEAVEIGEGGALLAVTSRLTGNNWDSELLIWTDVGPRPPPAVPGLHFNLCPSPRVHCQLAPQSGHVRQPGVTGAMHGNPRGISVRAAVLFGHGRAGSLRKPSGRGAPFILTASDHNHRTPLAGVPLCLALACTAHGQGSTVKYTSMLQGHGIVCAAPTEWRQSLTPTRVEHVRLSFPTPTNGYAFLTLTVRVTVEGVS